MAAVAEEVPGAPRSFGAVGCRSVRLERVGLRAGRSDAVVGYATSSCSAATPSTGEEPEHVGCTARVLPAEAWSHTAPEAGSTWTAEAFVETSAGRTWSSDGRVLRAMRRTQASWTAASDKSGGIVYASSRPSCLACLMLCRQLENPRRAADRVFDWGDSTYLRMCIRSSRLGCCRGLAGNMAGCLVSSSARYFPGWPVDRPGVRDD